jgi:hypothetical protein
MSGAKPLPPLWIFMACSRVTIIFTPLGDMAFLLQKFRESQLVETFRANTVFINVNHWSLP